MRAFLNKQSDGQGEILPVFHLKNWMLSPEIEDKIRKIIQEINSEAFIIEIALHRSKRSILSILVDTDKGITLPEIATLSRKIGWNLEESGDFDIAYTLEVSSPGVGVPLKILRQYIKNIGRNLKVTFNEGKEIKGKLIFVDESMVRLEPLAPKKNKKNRRKGEELSGELEIPFVEIKTAKVLVSFN